MQGPSPLRPQHTLAYTLTPTERHLPPDRQPRFSQFDKCNFKNKNPNKSDQVLHQTNCTQEVNRKLPGRGRGVREKARRVEAAGSPACPCRLLRLTGFHPCTRR